MVCRLNDCYLFVTDVFVGPALIRGLAEVVERRPNDPIEYLATFLYKQVENTRAQKQVRGRGARGNKKHKSYPERLPQGGVGSPCAEPCYE